MVKLNRTSEYGLIALRHMFQKQLNEDASVTSARDVADAYHLPFEITAKTLQRLKDTGLILSAQGARGGYTLNRNYVNYSFGEFIEMMEGPVAIVSCVQSEEFTTPCAYVSKCGMTDVMGKINDRVKSFLSTISLKEVLTDIEDLKPISNASLLNATEIHENIQFNANSPSLEEKL